MDDFTKEWVKVMAIGGAISVGLLIALIWFAAKIIKHYFF